MSTLFGALIITGFLPQDPGAMDAVLHDLRSDDPACRDRAFQTALRRYNEWSPQDLAKLRNAASSGDLEVSPRAKEALERIEIRKKSSPELLKKVKDFDGTLLEGRLKPCVKLLYEASRLVEENELSLGDLTTLVDLVVQRGVNVRPEIWSLTSEYPHKPYARFLRPILQSTRNDDEHDIAAAVLRLARVGGTDEFPLILPFLKSHSSEIRSCTVGAFAEIPDRKLMEPILPLLRDPIPRVRVAVLRTLASLPARDCGSLVAAALKDEDASVRACAAYALGRMGGLAQAAHVASVLGDTDRGVRTAALAALAEMDAAPHAGSVASLMNDPDVRVRAAAIRAMARLDSKESVRRIMPLVKDDQEFRWSVWNVLMSPQAREHAPSIVPLLKHSDQDVRGWAAATLGAMEATEQAPAIAELLRDPEKYVQRSAAKALSHLSIHLQKDRLEDGWIRQVRALEEAQEEDKWGLSLALLRLGGKSRQEQLELTRLMLRNRSHETTGYYDYLFRGLGEMNEPVTSQALARPITLRRAVESRADVEALFEERGLKLKGAAGWDAKGRTGPGREISLRDLLARHFDEWVPIPDKNGTLLLEWDKAFKHWLRRLDVK